MTESYMTLAEFYEDLYSDPAKLAAYRSDPEGYIQRSNLDPALMPIALSNDHAIIATALGEGKHIILLWSPPPPPPQSPPPQS